MLPAELTRAMAGQSDEGGDLLSRRRGLRVSPTLPAGQTPCSRRADHLGRPLRAKLVHQSLGTADEFG